MKDISTKENNKEVIAGFRVSKESVYYSALFGVAFAVSVVLLIFGKRQFNTGLVIYASVLIPIFLICTAIAARFACISKNKIYIKGGDLVIKTFFMTRKFKIAEIKKLTATQLGKEGPTSIKIKYREKNFKYTFKSLTKEDAAKLKRAVSTN